MATSYEIPLSPNAQTFSITLGANEYVLTVTWCDPVQVWLVSLADSGGTPLINSIPLVTGADLLGPYAYLELGGGLYAFTDHSHATPPAYDTLGNTSHLVFVTSP